ncbi:mitochondrial GTPase 1 [Anopheles darlingi]|uniref:Mitochondrial GTPase 1 n=1 Tax=Anopheles darlingi TaxID=43151 RepID=W5JGQ5_ANODA|nr:mitochondrial GTPase 1 [Anopheles darlingi]
MRRFRTCFPAVPRELLNWFPGHMGKGMKQMQQKLKQIDCVIEVHDARIPLTGRNKDFRTTVSGIKPHILVLNKQDLIERRTADAILQRLRQQDGETENIIFTNCKNQNCSGVRRVVPLAQELICGSDRYNRATEKDFCIMIIGVPNVGKSSLINALRNRHLHRKGASQVGALAGVTRSVLNRIRISQDPSVYLLDTPGILQPNIGDTETGLRLALQNFRYVELLGLTEPTDSIAEALVGGAVHHGKTIRMKQLDGTVAIRPDVVAAAKLMLKAFRTGALGRIMLDEDKINVRQ